MNGWPRSVYGVLLVAASMSVGWRIRGQFGHEIGAAIPGALGALAVALASGRIDWQRRAPYFALLGAIGWAFGGSISYMKVVAFTHSSDSDTVLYGFAGLYLIGSVWAALGGAGTALAAALDRDQLARLFPALVTVLAAWLVQLIVADVYELRGNVVPGWYDTDYLSAAVALVAALALAIVRRRIDEGTSLVLHLAIGWWIAFIVLVNALGWRLNPPRGDNWSGCVGLVGGMLTFCWRWRLSAVAHATIVTGFVGGAGFCLGQMLRLLGAAGDNVVSLHVALEWMQGALFGVALALGMARLVRGLPKRAEETPPRWTQTVALTFVLVVMLYLNAIRVPDRWMRDGNFPELVYGLRAAAGLLPSLNWIGWIEIIFLPLAALVLWGCTTRRQLPLLPATARGRAQMLYLLVLWAAAFLSATIEIARLDSKWFVIQWGITLHALACTVLILWGGDTDRAPEPASQPVAWPHARAVALGVLLVAATVLGGWRMKQATFGDTFVNVVNVNHIRFGPDNTNQVK